jgi:hypothetical protein
MHFTGYPEYRRPILPIVEKLLCIPANVVVGMIQVDSYRLLDVGVLDLHSVADFPLLHRFEDLVNQG